MPQIISLIFINLVTPKVRAKHELLFNKPATEQRERKKVSRWISYTNHRMTYKIKERIKMNRPQMACLVHKLDVHFGPLTGGTFKSPNPGAPCLTEVVWAKFSTLSWTVLIQSNVTAWHAQSHLKS